MKQAYLIYLATHAKDNRLLEERGRFKSWSLNDLALSKDASFLVFSLGEKAIMSDAIKNLKDLAQLFHDN